MENETKNIDMLIKAVSNLIDLGYDIELNIVGDGCLKEDLVKLTESLRIHRVVNFLGSFSNADLKDIFIKNDVFILPSRFDGWGFVAVEAMAHGLPVIISDRCGSYSIIKDKSHGVVFESSSLDSLVSSLRLIIDDINFYSNRSSKMDKISYVRNNLAANIGSVFLLSILEKLHDSK